MIDLKKIHRLMRLDSLFNRILLTMVLLFSLISAIFFRYWETQFAPLIKSAEQTKADILTTALMPTLSQILEHGDLDEIHLIVDQLILLTDPDTGNNIINGVVIEDIHGNIIVDSKTTSHSQEFKNTVTLFSTGPDRAILGQLTLFYSPRFYQGFYLYGKSVIKWGLFLISAILFISLFMLYFLLRPLWHLARELLDFSPARTEKLPELAGPSSIEIERVKDAINTLLESQSQHRQILRKKVEERTAELQLVNRALSESEIKYRNLVERSNDGIVILQEGLIKYINPKGVEIFGLEPSGAIDHVFADYVAEGAQKKWLRSRYGDKTASQKPLIYEASLCRKDGTLLNIELNDCPVTYREKQAYLVFIRDITERKRLESEIIKNRNLESLGVLAGGIAHDFNNLLTTIFGYIDLARDHIDPANDTYSMLTEALKASELSQHLTRQLLTFSKGGTPIKKVTSLTKLVQEKSSFTMSGSNIKYEIIPEQNLWAVEADIGQMEQVIQNLLINAKEAMPEGGNIYIELKNHIVSDSTSSLEEGKYVKLSIIDNGPGIRSEVLPSIFDPYFSTKSMGYKKGTGLGLAICHSIVKQHRGDILVSSLIGQGTTFDIYLPMVNKTIEEEEVEQQPRAIGKDKEQGKILLMDDEEAIQLVGGDMLKHLGYEVVYAKDGTEAISLYQQAQESEEPFEAVILDLTIRGGLGGEKAIETLREMDPNVFAIVASGYTNNPVMAEYKKYGFEAAIEKPFTLVSLRKVLAERMGEQI